MVSLGVLARKIFGSSNDRRIKSTRPRVEAINAMENELRALSDAELAARTDQFRTDVANGASLDDLLVPAFATVREASRRVLDMRPFDVQLVGGMVLHNGGIAEMRTGEGKTLVATLPVYLNALAGKGVHVVTVNDYLAKRDSEWMGRVYKFLGLSVGVIVHGLTDDERHAAYAADVTYATNNELGFDYLRDNMKYDRQSMVQRGHNYAIVDEVDSILVDEARTPLIISGPLEDRSEMYNTIDAFMLKLDPADYEIDEKQRTCDLHRGRHREAGEHAARGGPPQGRVALRRRERRHRAPRQQCAEGASAVPEGQGLHRPQQRDRHHRRVHRPHDAGPPLFGRPAPGARSQGACGDPAGEPDARLGHLPELLPHVQKLSGMTGTALTEAEEFGNIYGLEVTEVPTNLPVSASTRTTRSTGPSRRNTRRSCARSRRPATRASRSSSAPPRSKNPSSWPNGCARTASRVSRSSTPATTSSEAAIVAQAGVPGVITIATNMAGRGTDIQLGGNADMRIAEELADMPEGAEREAAEKAIRDDVQRLKEKAIAAGGLYVLASERHESRRIDNQLRGRSGRQGDPGRSKFFLSLQDDLMRIFGSERMDGMLQKLGLKEDEAIIHPWINKALEKAQKKVEARNFDIRKNLLEVRRRRQRPAQGRVRAAHRPDGRRASRRKPSPRCART